MNESTLKGVAKKAAKSVPKKIFFSSKHLTALLCWSIVGIFTSHHVTERIVPEVSFPILQLAVAHQDVVTSYVPGTE